MFRYPQTQPLESGHLRVSSRHRIYYEVYGNPKGIPLFSCNGGPGMGFSSSSARYYDPKKYRIVMFDQRGAGRSLPVECLIENTTADMLLDIERLMKHLSISKAVFTGGSWGSTLALLQAVTSPDRVLGVVGHGIFLGSREDIDYLYRGGTRWSHPEAWHRFVTRLPPADREDPVEAYGVAMTTGPQATRDRFAAEWTLYEHQLLDSRTDYTLAGMKKNMERLRPLCLIENHWMRHDCFLTLNHLVRRGHRLEGMPVTLIHGRHDSVCPAVNAWRMHRATPGSELIMVPRAGHGCGHPGIQEAYEDALERLAETLTEKSVKSGKKSGSPGGKGSRKSQK